jgi:hypothetical protein
VASTFAPIAPAFVRAIVPAFVCGCTTEEMEDDPCVELMRTETEEGKKVEREGRFEHDKYYMVYTRIDDTEEKKNMRTDKGWPP